jgi:hypothetical protein
MLLNFLAIVAQNVETREVDRDDIIEGTRVFFYVFDCLVRQVEQLMRLGFELGRRRCWGLGNTAPSHYTSSSTALEFLSLISCA